MEAGRIGDYTGYSGSPVEVSRGQPDHRIVGILLEQHEDRAITRRAELADLVRATGGLVAAKFATIYDFTHFAEIVHRVISAEQMPRDDTGSSRLERISTDVRNAQTTLDAIRDMAKNGFLPSADIDDIQARVMSALKESLQLGDASRE